MTRWILKQMLSYARPPVVVWTNARGIGRMMEWAVDRTMGARA